MKNKCLYVLIISTLLVSACQSKSPQEEAKEHIEGAINQAKVAAAAANEQTEKAMEQANEMMDDAFENADKQMEDAQKQIADMQKKQN